MAELESASQINLHQNLSPNPYLRAAGNALPVRKELLSLSIPYTAAG